VPRRSKVCPLAEAARLVTDGASLLVAGAHFNNVAMALVRQVIRQGTRDLELIPTPSAGLWVDMLIAAGAVRKLHVSYIGLEFVGMAPNFRRAAEAGQIEISEEDEPTIFHGLRAAASGLPFAALPPIHLLTDLPRVNPSVYREITDPFTGRPAIAVPPLAPDVALIHVARCDPYGNAVSLGGLHMEDVIGKASKRVIVSAEELVAPEEISGQPTATVLPGYLVAAVVHAPYGVHPGTCPGHYGYDRAHLEHYAALAQADRTGEYLDEYVHGPRDHFAYLDKIGVERLLSLRFA
jgi:glutaconate CoA-transferase, subunit A